MGTLRWSMTVAGVYPASRAAAYRGDQFFRFVPFLFQSRRRVHAQLSRSLFLAVALPAVLLQDWQHLLRKEYDCLFIWEVAHVAGKNHARGAFEWRYLGLEILSVHTIGNDLHPCDRRNLSRQARLAFCRNQNACRLLAYPPLILLQRSSFAPVDSRERKLCVRCVLRPLIGIHVDKVCQNGNGARCRNILGHRRTVDEYAVVGMEG